MRQERIIQANLFEIFATHEIGRVSMAGRTRLYPARDASASSDVGLPRFDASGDVSKIDGVMASRWLPPVRR
jgi:hypothetical protein